MNNYFEYRIYNTVYDEIVHGKKRIEFRLLNEKSESIKIGDEIRFKIEDDDSKFILTEVTNKYIYEDIDDLWKHRKVLTNVLGYSKEEFVSAFYEIFGKEKVLNSKIVGIEFKLKKFQ